MSDGKRSDDDDLPAARDFSSVKGGGRDKYTARLRKGNNLSTAGPNHGPVRGRPVRRRAGLH